jgi:hypothetical protein
VELAAELSGSLDVRFANLTRDVSGAPHWVENRREGKLAHLKGGGQDERGRSVNLVNVEGVTGARYVLAGPVERWQAKELGIRGP